MKKLMSLVPFLFLFPLAEGLCQQNEPPSSRVQPHPVVFWELASHDQEKSVEFFRAVFGWTITYSEKAGFYIVPPADHAPATGGGIFTLKKARLPFLTVYIQVDDLQEKVDLVQKHGGLIVDPPSKTAGGSTICLFTEPSGVVFAMIQPASDKP